MSAFKDYIKTFATKNVSNLVWFVVGLLLGAFVL